MRRIALQWIQQGLPICGHTLGQKYKIPGISGTGAEQQRCGKFDASRGSGSQKLDAHRQSTGRTEGCRDSLGGGKLSTVENLRP